jgi:HemY protein
MKFIYKSLVLILFFFIRTLLFLFSIKTRIRKYSDLKRSREDDKYLRKALHEMLVGSFTAAERSIAKVSDNYGGRDAHLIRIWCAHYQGKLKQREQLISDLEKSGGSDDDDGLLLAKVKMMLDDGRGRDALTFLNQIKGTSPDIDVISLRTFESVGKWPDVLRLIKVISRRKSDPGPWLNKTRLNAYVGLFGMEDISISEASDWYDGIPSDHRGNTDIERSAANCFIRLREHKRAAGVIERVLDSSEDDILLELYLACHSVEIGRRLDKAESWLTKYPRNSILLRVLGTFCREAKIWGKAESYLRASVAIRDSVQARLQLAKVYEATDRIPDAESERRAAVDINLVDE